MKTSHIVSLSASVLLVGGLAAAGISAELSAQHDREGTVRDIVAAVAPGSDTAGIDVHGRPLFLSDKGTVSTAYVNVTADEKNSQWIIQDYRDKVIGLLDIIVPVTLPGGPAAQPAPVPDTTDGSFTDRGRFNGAEVVYAATLDGGVLTVTADGVPVATVDLPGVTTADTLHTYVGEGGVSVNLQTRHLTV